MAGVEERVRRWWDERPLAVVMFAAVAARLLAVLLSRGFAFYDDHFSVVEPAQRWADGRPWLDAWMSLRSLVYPGAHAALFGAFDAAGLGGPEPKMLAARALHGAWSLLAVLFGYEAARALQGVRAARKAGLVLALFWLLPSMAVRNLVEVVCQPPLLAGLYLLVRDREETRGRDEALAGALFALAFVLRFQTAVMAAAVGAVLLARRQLPAAVRFSLGFAACAAVVQGGSDLAVHGDPAASVRNYLAFNSDPANVKGFPQGRWHQYLGLVAGVMLPPMGLLLLAGFAGAWRRLALVVWPAVAFVALHSAYPNKQERFILPALPLLLLAGVLGWEELGPRWRAWRERPGLRRGLWGLFWAVNAALFFLVGMNDWKRARWEALELAGAQPGARGVLLEADLREVPDPPIFYLGKDLPAWELARADEPAALREEILGSGDPPPNVVLVIGEQDLPRRLARIARAVPGRLVEVGRSEPSLLDRALRKMNPRMHQNFATTVYRVEE